MNPVVTTSAGRVRGIRRPGDGFDSHAFLGIPYAAPPVGDLRFAAPEPHPRWDGVREAAKPGPTPQRRPFAAVTTVPEPSVPGDDILNVSVFTPDPGAAGMPVMVWIHGGGYVAGSPASPWYDGAAFNRDGIVTVNISYRLGHQGFGFVPGTVGNRGVLDWLAALRWVQDNIATFGGDPSQVTIAGQSAGGGAVLQLLGLESAHGLFRGAISLSGVATRLELDEAMERSRRVAAAAGVQWTAEGFASLSDDALLDAQTHAIPATPGMAGLESSVRIEMNPCPVVDGEVVPADTLEAFRQGHGASIPLMIGATDDEFSGFARSAADEIVQLGGIESLVRLGLPQPDAESYARDNAPIAERGPTDLVGRFLSDVWFRSVLPAVADVRDREHTWAYRMAWRSRANGLSEHCLDLPFFFDCLDAPSVTAMTGDHPPQSLATELHGAAARFIASGDPGWRPWGDSASVRVLADASNDVAGALDSSVLARAAIDG